MYTWAYKRNEKVRFPLDLNNGKKRLAACFLHNIDIAGVSECLCHPRVQYPIKFPDIGIGQQNLRIDHPISIMEWPRSAVVINSTFTAICPYGLCGLTFANDCISKQTFN